MSIEEMLKEMGFEICLFPPDDSECERCGETWRQLYFQGPTDAGRYCCLNCVKEEYEINIKLGMELGIKPERPEGE